MKKALIIAATATVLGGSVFAYSAYAHWDGWRHGRYGHGGYSAADMSAFAEARIAALKAGLALNAEQEKLWPPVETALRELAQKRLERHEQFRAERRDRAEPVNPIERLRRGSDRLTETGADLKRLADAAEPLYQSLDEAQKRRLETLIRPGMGGMHRGMGRHRFGELGDEGRHFGPRMGPRDHGPERGMGWHRRTGWDNGRGPQLPAGAERL